MSNSFAQRLNNKKAFWNETNLYRVEPLVQTTVCWMEISDMPDIKKARTLHFSELKGNELYAKFVSIGENSYWKMYIIGTTNVDIVYLQTATLNPIGSYRP